MPKQRNDFEAPFVLVDRCGTYSADLDEPGICTNCGWLLDEHPELAALGVAA